MKETLSKYEIADRLYKDENSSFDYVGALALAEYLEQLEEDLGEEIEFDRVAIRCDYCQYETAREAAEDHGWEVDAESEEQEADALQWLQDRTTVIDFEGGIIIQQF